MSYDLTGKRVWVAGHRGMVGQALVRRLAAIDCEVQVADREELDLTDQRAVLGWLHNHRPQAVFLAAARVGGIQANLDHPVDFLRDNLLIATAVLAAAESVGVEKLLLLGSSCIYPRDAAQPIREEALLSGPLEPSNAGYALAKIAGIALAQAYRAQYGCDFISAMPTNLYGPGDNYDPDASHVLPALIRKVAAARQNGGAVTLWGSGTPLREFLHADDCADALVFLMQHYSAPAPINVGSGEELSIRQLAELVMEVIGHRGEIVLDPSHPDGTPRKLLDSTRLRQLGWAPRIGLREGIAQTYAAYRDGAGRAI